jgi:hypothetical protein
MTILLGSGELPGWTTGVIGITLPEAGIAASSAAVIVTSKTVLLFPYDDYILLTIRRMST